METKGFTLKQFARGAATIAGVIVGLTAIGLLSYYVSGKTLDALGFPGHENL